MTTRGTGRRGWRYRANVAARVVAGTVGAYAVAACLAMAVARLFPAARVDAVIAGTLLAFLAAPAVAIWAFLARGPLRAWAGVAVAIGLFGGVAWLVGSPRP